MSGARKRLARGVFWGSAVTIAYTYVGFPMLLLARARLSQRPLRPQPHPDTTRTVSVVVAAHNEEAAIAGKLRSLLANDYTSDAMEIIVASDGSTDSTVDAVTAVGDPRVRLLDLPRVGKAEALNRAIASATGEIIVFTDANSMFAPDAITNLLRPFDDPDVGGVAGDQRYQPDQTPEGTGAGEADYWSFDRMLKEAESAAGNVISATGAIYAVRRSLCQPVPVGVTDDFATSTAVICQNKRLVFEGTATAYEPVASSTGDEFDRKVRIMTRGLRGVWLRRELLNPRRHGFYAVQLLSHKVLRRMMVIPLATLLLSSLAVARGRLLYRLATAAQLGLYTCGLAGLLLRRTKVGRHRLLSLPAYFLTVNAASVVALANLVRGRRIDRWTTARTPSTPGSP